MKYFTSEELMNSNTARRLGIHNWTNDPTIWNNLHALVDNILDPAREKLGRPIYVNSGYRSKETNIAVGGATNSQHTRGEACDVWCKGDLYELYRILKEMDFDQLITYEKKHKNFIHVSYVTYRPNRRMILHY